MSDLRIVHLSLQVLIAPRLPLARDDQCSSLVPMIEQSLSSASEPDTAALETEVDEAIATCGGDIHAAVRVLQ